MMIRSFVQKSKHGCARIKNLILDGLFPIRCLGCGTFDCWLCDTCHTMLPVLPEQHCPMCKKHVTPNGDICHACDTDGDIAFDGVFVASYYHDTLLRKAIHYYKYRFVTALAAPLALLLAQSLQHGTLPTPDVIIPVPLHKRRLRWRGFNQAELLIVALDLQIPTYPDILKRIRYTKPQVRTIDKEERHHNLAHAFRVDNAQIIRGKSVLLVDDVMTTGATLDACARALKEAGARHVHCAVLARE